MPHKRELSQDILQDTDLWLRRYAGPGQVLIECNNGFCTNRSVIDCADDFDFDFWTTAEHDGSCPKCGAKEHWVACRNFHD
jgi:hypothetical protein